MIYFCCTSHTKNRTTNAETPGKKQKKSEKFLSIFLLSQNNRQQKSQKHLSTTRRPTIRVLFTTILITGRLLMTRASGVAKSINEITGRTRTEMRCDCNYHVLLPTPTVNICCSRSSSFSLGENRRNEEKFLIFWPICDSLCRQNWSRCITCGRDDLAR